jgi:hypothetical protein
MEKVGQFQLSAVRPRPEPGIRARVRLEPAGRQSDLGRPGPPCRTVHGAIMMCSLIAGRDETNDFIMWLGAVEWVAIMFAIMIIRNSGKLCTT